MGEGQGGGEQGALPFTCILAREGEEEMAGENIF